MQKGVFEAEEIDLCFTYYNFTILHIIEVRQLRLKVFYLHVIEI